MNKDNKIMIIAVIFIIIIIAIAGIVYLLSITEEGSGCSTCSKLAAFSASAEADSIKISLSKGISSTPSGGWPENKWIISVNDEVVDNTGQGSWDVGGSFFLKQNSNGDIVFDNTNAFDLSKGQYRVTITINGSTVFDEIIEIVGPTSNNSFENAAVTVSACDNKTIKVMLVTGGDMYDDNNGYSSDDFRIFINGEQVTDITDPWFIGGKWHIDSELSVNSQTPVGFDSDSEQVITVAIMDTVILDATVSIS